MQIMLPVRIFFAKTGRAKYISHLDTMRMFTRAFVRSGLPLWYTQGFNPHVYMTFALPIALGYESTCESVDVRLTKEMEFSQLVQTLNAALPPGFTALRAAEPVMKPSEIAWADYDVRLVYPPPELPEQLLRLEAFLRQPVIEVRKRTKKGDKTVDIKPLAQLLDVRAQDDALALRLRLASGGTVNINPSLYLSAFYGWANREPDGVKITRTAIYTETLQLFE